MKPVRNTFAYLLAVVLFASLLGLATAVNFERTLGEPAQVKQLLRDSGVYDKAVSAALDKSQADALREGNDSSIQLDHTIVQQAAKRSFTPQLLEENTDQFIDANYDWLAGRTQAPEFALDLSDAKKTFARLAGEYTAARLMTLPACTDQELSQLQLPVDPMSVRCLPATIDPDREGARLTAEIGNSNFLTEPVITPETLGRDKNSSSKPYYQQLSDAPKIYQLSQKLPIILAVLALLMALLIILVSPVRRKGWRRVAVVLLVSGLLLIGLVLAGGAAVSQAESRLTDSVSSQLSEPRRDFLQHLQDRMNGVNLVFGGAYAVIALLILARLYMTRQRGTETAVPPVRSAPQQLPPQQARPAAQTPAPLPRRPAAPPARANSPTVTDIAGPSKPPTRAGVINSPPVPPARAGTAPTLPQLKKPAKKRPPRLIQ